MDKSDYIKQFKEIYPECPVLKTYPTKSGDGLVIYTDYQGYQDYYRVGENFVSCAYSNLEDAQNDMEWEEGLDK